MLLPSALPCDVSHNARIPRYQQTALFASPPVSPQPTSQSKLTNLYSTCRALHSMLASSSPSQLSSPPLESEATMTPRSSKLRLRNRKIPPATVESDVPATPRMRITKRQVPPRGLNKRRRSTDEREERDEEVSETEHNAWDLEDAAGAPSTPKRLRLAPEILPRGLERSDFQSLQRPTDMEATTEDSHLDEHDWSSEEDRILVELVLEKLKLSKSDWQDCARSLGKDRNSVGRRWKSLIINGEVGLKRASRSRARIHGTWR